MTHWFTAQLNHSEPTVSQRVCKVDGRHNEDAHTQNGLHSMSDSENANPQVNRHVLASDHVRVVLPSDLQRLIDRRVPTSLPLTLSDEAADDWS